MVRILALVFGWLLAALITVGVVADAVMIGRHWLVVISFVVNAWVLQGWVKMLLRYGNQGNSGEKVHKKC